MPAILFWSCAALVLYTYAGYPLAIWFLARGRPSDAAARLSEAELPSVTLCIAIHNEAARILPKLENLRQLAYPRHLVEIIFSSDGSTDGSRHLLEGLADVRFLEGPRGGKTAALRRAVSAARGDIVVFTDARQMLSSNALEVLVRRLAMPGVGVASGLLVYRDPKGSEASGADLYWRYEAWIRRQEGRFSSLIGATGALYAMRRADIIMPADGTLLDDFEIPIQVLRQGQRIVLEERALAIDEASNAGGSERRRKIRTLAGNFQSFRQQVWLFSPSSNPAWWQFISHKVLRLAVPPLMLGTFVGAALAEGPLYQAAFFGQVLFHSIAAAGLYLPALRKSRLVNVCSVFVDLNIAAVQGLFVYATGGLDRVWAPPHETDRSG